MAMFELLLSSLLFSLVLSAPFNISTEATEESYVNATTIADAESDIGKDLKPSATPEVPAYVPAELLPSDLAPDRKEPSVPAVLDKQEASPPSHVRPFVNIPRPFPVHSPKPIPVNSPKPIPQNDFEEIKEQGVDQGKPPQTQAPVYGIRHSVRELPSGDDVRAPQFEQQQQGESQPQPDPRYASSYPEQQHFPPQVPYSEEVPSDVSVSQEPADQARAPNDGRLFLVDVQPVVQEEVAFQPNVPSPDQVSSENVESPGGPQLFAGKESSQVDGPDYVRPELGPSFDDPSVQSANPDDSPFPIAVDLAEDIGGPVAPPVDGEKEPPAVLVREDLVPPVQDASQYHAPEVAPLSVEPAAEEPSQEENVPPNKEIY